MRNQIHFVLLLTLTAPLLASDKLVIHEWGTFTALQDENGRAIGGVNIDDEPLPSFVHRLGEKPATTQPAENALEIFSAGKSIYPGHPSVTMRLETPVMYFYPPDNKPITLDVTATFNGGVLSEFFPDGAPILDGKPLTRPPENVSPKSRGSITWKNVQLNSSVPPPQTDSHVWITPRKTAAAPLQVGNEGEKYIFYRGVGHFDAPLSVRRGYGDWLDISPAGSFAAHGMWLADFRSDGTCAFRAVDVGYASAQFTESEYASDNVTKLRAAMKQALLADGLFADEAEAMLETWKLSYFNSTGQRLFFLVPMSWTDEVLPLKFSRPAEVTRVMIGRIELVTPQQRAVVTRLTDLKLKPDEATQKELLKTLGRFSTALVNDGHRRRSEAEAQLRAMQLQEARPSSPPIAASGTPSP